MKLLIRTSRSNDFAEGYDFALVDFTPELLTLIHNRRMRFKLMASVDRDLTEMEFFGAAEFFDYRDDVDDDILGGTEDDPFGQQSFAAAPADFTYEAQRTECDRMVITKDGVYFKAYPKHCDWKVETYEIPYAALDKEAS